MIRLMLGRQLRLAWLALVLILPALIFQLADDSVSELLRYQRDAIVTGEYWRVLSGHFVHLGTTHFLLNAAAVLILALGFGWHIRTSPLLIVLAGLGLALGVSGGLYFFNPELDWYVGLSGLLHGLAVLVALRVRRQEPVIGWVLLVGVALKVVWEQLVGSDPALAKTIGGAVVIDAHLYGLISGLLLHLASYAINRFLLALPEGRGEQHKQGKNL